MILLFKTLLHYIIILYYTLDCINLSSLRVRKTSVSIKKQFIKTMTWSVTLYGAESWTILKADRRRIIKLFET